MDKSDNIKHKDDKIYNFDQRQIEKRKVTGFTIASRAFGMFRRKKRKERRHPSDSNLYVYSSSSACSRRPCLELRYSLLWNVLVSESSESDAEGVWVV
jgi:hypothetical protein